LPTTMIPTNLYKKCAIYFWECLGRCPIYIVEAVENEAYDISIIYCTGSYLLFRGGRGR
jgi:hypothetical protein